MKIKENIEQIPDYRTQKTSVSTKELAHMRNLQREYMKRRKVKVYGTSRHRYRLVKKELEE